MEFLTPFQTFYRGLQIPTGIAFFAIKTREFWLHFIRYAYAGNAFLAYARKAFTGLQLYRCHPTKLSPGWSQNSRVLIRTLDGAFNPIPTFYRGLQIPTGIAFFAIKTREF